MNNILVSFLAGLGLEAHEKDLPFHDEYIISQIFDVNLEYSRKYKEFKRQMDRKKKKDLKIVLIGERGVGKTTFVEYLDQMCINRKWSHDKVRQERTQGLPGGMTYYSLEDINDRSRTIRLLEITLPEVLSNDAFSSDEQKAISREIKNGLLDVDAILMVVNGTHIRPSTAYNQALQSVSAILPASFSQNIGFLLTNCDISTANFDMNELPEEHQDAFSCHLQNPIPLLRKYEEAEKKKNIRGCKLKLLQRNAAKAFLDSLDIVDDLFDWLDSRTRQSGKTIVDLCDILDTLKALAFNLVSQIALTAEIRNEIKELDIKIQDLNLTIGAKHSFQKTVNRQVWQRVYTPRKNTICLADGCHSNCHESCHTHPILLSKEVGQRCWAFRDADMRMGANAVCTECKHTIKYHHNVNDLWELRSTTTLVTDEEATKAFQEAKVEEEQQKRAKDVLEQTLMREEKQSDEIYDQFKLICAQYEESVMSKKSSQRICLAIDHLRGQYNKQGENLSPSNKFSELQEVIHELRRRSGGDTLAKGAENVE
ncbi:hypothetical protein CPB86DRAFT_817516 [Serendipita vermifera]|nr:hypothetical protein CPB86DRAFT_817516 [Serendipita vermifera]